MSADHENEHPGENITVEARSISTEFAQRLLSAGMEYSKRISKPLTISVVDSSGLLLGFIRGVGAPLATIQTSHDKAWTAVATKRPTHEWSAAMRTDEPLRLGVVGGIQRAIVFGGGYPIVEDGEIVGGLGVSGAHYDVDREAAEAILDTLGVGPNQQERA